MLQKLKLIFLEKILGQCQRCKTYFSYPKTRRMNTMYENEKLNFVCECNKCFEQTEAYWDGMWEDYDIHNCYVPTKKYGIKNVLNIKLVDENDNAIFEFDFDDKQ